MKDKFYEEIVSDVKRDFEERRQARRNLELQWRLNMNYLIGNQYCDISARGDIEDMGKQYFWQEREVFNHIAPIIETRIAKMDRVQADVTVRPQSADSEDVNSAKLSSKILKAVFEDKNMSALTNEANTWSEVCGTAFFKIVWNSAIGKTIGKKKNTYIREGDVDISVCPPFEIYPDNLNATRISDCNSIIHAKAYPISTIKDIWGEEVESEDVNVFLTDNTDIVGGLGYSASIQKLITTKRDDLAIVIERYTLPSQDNPNGRLTIVAGDKLLYDGDLPYLNGNSGMRGFPFVKQTSIASPGSFFGGSVIERIIPVQRAYNAIKNRKHEFINRISMGVLAVEDGSVDTDNLEEEGLSPGKILVYRQGSTPPRLLDGGSLPNDFLYEEERLLKEFTAISGVSETMQYSTVPTANASGKAINLLLEQDDTRLVGSADSIRNAHKEIAYHVLRLYKQFADGRRLLRVSGDNGETEVLYFTKGDIGADFVVFETGNDLMSNPENRRNTLIEMYKLGLLDDENGKLSPRMKSRIAEAMGIALPDMATDIMELNMKVADKENTDMYRGKSVGVNEFDNHDLHIEEHIKGLMVDRDNKMIEEHIREHRKYALLSSQTQLEGETNGTK